MVPDRADGRIRIAFVLTELTIGGAELMLYKLLSRIDRRRFDPFVLTLSTRIDELYQRVQDIRVPCELFGMKQSPVGVAALVRLVRALRSFQPHLVQGWLYHGNLAASLARLALPSPRPAVLWSVRGTLIRGPEKRSGLAIYTSGRLSGTPSRVIYNSTASAIEHESRLGYRAANRVVLPNGFDTDLFRPSPEARKTVRQALGLSPETLVIGLIARYHPMKDHENFLRAAALVKAAHPAVRYLLVGEDVDASNRELAKLIEQHGLNREVHLLGLREDMAAVTAALDIAVSSSASGEGFPNVLGEAMSCGVPCATTDVGDSARIVGQNGYSVPPRDAQALAAAIVRLIECGEDGRLALGRRARESVIERFSLDAVVRSYEELYLQVHSGMSRAGA